ncbi:polyhydroxyalkanoic acid system family protein [Sorangium sp. So ce124]|uniref:polyhydroxyalkanoic acid system family protein n=1 Tax=Sorangium sp. So ce124 TaxID=3133280 RepID=UPI003F638278
MNHTVHHDLNDEEAKSAVLRAMAKYCDRYAEYAPSILWSDERHAHLGLSFKGFTLSGRLELRPRAVDFAIDMPLPLRMFNRMAIAAIDAEVRRCIDDAHRERARRRAPVALAQEGPLSGSRHAERQRHDHP